MKLLLENWRKYLNEGIDPEIIEHIRKAIEERIEIPVKKMFLMEDSTVLVHLQVDLNEHASELMSLIHERWKSSDELKRIKEMGYDVRLGAIGDDVDGPACSLNKGVVMKLLLENWRKYLKEGWSAPQTQEEFRYCLPDIRKSQNRRL